MITHLGAIFHFSLFHVNTYIIYLEANFILLPTMLALQIPFHCLQMKCRECNYLKAFGCNQDTCARQHFMAYIVTVIQDKEFMMFLSRFNFAK